MNDFKHLYNHFISNNLISKNQSGFRPGDSCSNQLLSLVHEIHKAFDDKNCLEVRSVYLDLSKAFDKVWHGGLMFKLKQNGVNGKLLSLLDNYLQNRQQRVVINGQESKWAHIKSGVPQGSVLGPLMFLIFINDLESNLKCQVNFFADDTSIFTVVRDPEVSASDLNHDLDVIARWAHQWKMAFNPDPTKPAEEIVFSNKKVKVHHPPIFFNNIEVKRVNHHKHLGLILDSRLSFSNHINEKVNIARKWIGIIRHLKSVIPIKSLDQIYKMQIRSHFDFCDIIYHKPPNKHDFNSSTTLNSQMNLLERIQYQAALAITGTWKGTNTDKIYEELGWETLDNRRLIRRLLLFYKIMNHLSPNYLLEPLPIQQGRYRLRNNCIINTIPCRTDNYRNSFYPNTISLWNGIDTHLKNSPSLTNFKSSLIKIIRPSKKSVFGIHDTRRLKWIFQLRVSLSPLKVHKKLHNFVDTTDDSCQCQTGSETTLHFLLKCPRYNEPRNEMMNTINAILLSNDLTISSDILKVNLLLYGHQTLSYDENKSVLTATINFIHETGRFFE